MRPMRTGGERRAVSTARRAVAARLSCAAAIATLLTVWQVAALFLPGFLLPSIPQTAARAAELLRDPAILEGIRQSFLRLGTGYPLGCVLGASLGLGGGLFRPLGLYLRALISMLQSVPPITWVPFLIILFGFGNVPVIVVIIISSFFPMALTVLNGADGVTRAHVEVARVMGATRWHLLTKVFAPETLPAVITGAQVAFGNAWRSLVAAEMVAGVSSGLGWSISYAGEVADMAGVLVGIVVVGAAAAAIDSLVLEQLKRRLLHWRNTAGEDVP